jgi:hypothetical protein
MCSNVSSWMYDFHDTSQICRKILSVSVGSSCWQNFVSYLQTVSVILFRLKSSDDSGEEEVGNKDLQKAEKESLVSTVNLL